MTDGAHAAGADGCRRGWVVVTRGSVAVVDDLEQIVVDATFSPIGVDMPIGLPEQWGREADRAARRFLGAGRGSTVFPTPPRSLLDERDYAAANRRSREEHGRGLPKQGFHLLRRMREIDALARAQPRDRIVEVHPECSFRALSGGALPSKRTAAGIARRRSLLLPIFGTAVDERPAGAAADDVLDAFAVLWSAERFGRGQHIEHGDGATDHFGLPMRIIT